MKLPGLDSFFADGCVPRWLKEFEQEPLPALTRLLAGSADLGHLGPADPVVLLRTWVERLADTSVTEIADQTLADWIGAYWGHASPDFAGDSAAVTADAWIAACDLVWSSARSFSRAAERLRDLFLSSPHFLRSLSEGLSRDPEASAWLVLAYYQTDRTLLSCWWKLVNLEPDVPWYHGRLGLEGLRRLPHPPTRQGVSPREVQEGLFRLGEALARREEEGFLPAPEARAEFLRCARTLMRAYPSAKWKSFFRDTVSRSRQADYVTWLKSLGFEQSDLAPGRSTFYPDIHSWGARAKQIADRLRQNDAAAFEDAAALLDEESRYAQETGDTDHFGRSAANFANAASSKPTEHALQWLERGIAAEPSNAFLWNLKVKVLLLRGCISNALPVALAAFQRFPDNVVARNGLGEVLRQANRLPEAEQIYRETIQRFPDNVVARNCLGEVLRQANRLPEAEQIYRETVQRFPDDVFARTGLGEVLRQANRLPEAEQIYLETIQRFPDNVVARTGLGEVLRQANRLPEAEQIYRETVRRFPDEVYTRNGLGGILRQANRLPEAEQIYRETIQRFPDNVVAHNGLGEVLRQANRLPEAEQIYRETIQRFPDNVVARNGLVEVLRQANRLREAEQIYRETTQHPPAAQVGVQAEDSALHVETYQSPGEDLALRSTDLTTLLTDAYFNRMWARAEERRLTSASRASLHDLARRLFRSRNDPTAGSEFALLEIDRGEIEEALRFLRLAARRFPGSGRIRYALARAEREAAGRSKLHLDAPESRMVLHVWNSLPAIDQRLQPVRRLGLSRAWLALSDGRRVEDGVRENYGHLASFLRPYVSVEPKTSVATWAQRTFRFVFGESSPLIDDPTGELDVGYLRDRDAQYGPVLNELEELYVKRICP